MEIEDQQRFNIDAIGDYLGNAKLWLSCTRCEWVAEPDEPLTLAELNQEVCR